MEGDQRAVGELPVRVGLVWIPALSRGWTRWSHRHLLNLRFYSEINHRIVVSQRRLFFGFDGPSVW